MTQYSDAESTKRGLIVTGILLVILGGVIYLDHLGRSVSTNESAPPGAIGYPKTQIPTNLKNQKTSPIARLRTKGPEATIRRLFEALYKGDIASVEDCFSSEFKMTGGLLYQITLQDTLLPLPKRYENWQIKDSKIIGNTAFVRVKLTRHEAGKEYFVIYQFTLYNRKGEGWKVAKDIELGD
jgi:hypothetical protein